MSDFELDLNKGIKRQWHESKWEEIDEDKQFDDS